MNRKFCSLLVAASFGLCAGTALAAPRVATDFANLRSGPGAKWPVIAQIPAGAKIDVSNCGPGWKRDWCNVTYKGKQGFVAASTLAPTKNAIIVAPLVTRAPTKLRKGPGSSSKVIAHIPPGTKVVSSGCSTQGWLNKWCKVQYEGKSGYVDRAFLKRKGQVFAP